MADEDFQPLDRLGIARRIAQDIPEGWFVNLGIGIPTTVSDFVPPDREVIFHSENGVIGIGPAPAEDAINPYLVNAGVQPITLRTGGAYVHHADSFAIARGGHLDLCVLGAFQVSADGDLANWHTGAVDAIPAVGGAMDLAIGAKRTVVMMEHLTKSGESKLVQTCRYPLTGIGCVRRVYTDLAVIDLRPGKPALVIERVAGLSFEDLQGQTAIQLIEETP